MAKGIALNVGLNSVDPEHYAGWDGRLGACEADADDMSDLAKSAGFEARSLLTRHATRAAVMKGIRDAAAELKAGDIFLFTFSGHGGQVRDLDGDEVEDNEDETLLCYDAQIVDDEIYRLWAKFEAGVRVLMIADSCHSGTVAKLFPYRDTGAKGTLVDEIELAKGYRFMPDDVARRTFKKNEAFYEKIVDRKKPGEKERVKASVLLLSGCQDNQLSADGVFNGLFTGRLLRAWKRGRFTGTYTSFHKAIVKTMPPLQTPNKYWVPKTENVEFEAQKPFTI